MKHITLPRCQAAKLFDCIHTDRDIPKEDILVNVHEIDRLYGAVQDVSPPMTHERDNGKRIAKGEKTTNATR